MSKDKKIFRSLGSISREFDENSRRIEGCAIVFDSFSRDFGGFVEKISRDAVTEDLVRNSDIIMNIDHDNSKMLARSNRGEGTLELELKEDGLYFSFDAPTTALGDEVLFNVRNGNLFECSFACFLDKSKVKRYKEGDQYIQEICAIEELLDCSIVVHAAYPATSVSLRDEDDAKKEFEDIKREVDEEEAKLAAAEEEKRKALIINELDSMKDEFLKFVEN